MAVEDVRPALPEDNFANAVQTSIDTVRDTIDELIYSKENEVSNTKDDNQPNGDSVEYYEDADFSDLNEKINSNGDQPSEKVNRGDRVLFYGLTII